MHLTRLDSAKLCDYSKQTWRRSTGLRIWGDGRGIRRSVFREFLNVEILIPFFLPFYLFGIIPFIVPFFAVLDIYKGTRALALIE